MTGASPASGRAPHPGGVPQEERDVEAADELLAGEGERDVVGQQLAPGEADRIALGSIAGGEHLR